MPGGLKSWRHKEIYNGKEREASQGAGWGSLGLSHLAAATRITFITISSRVAAGGCVVDVGTGLCEREIPGRRVAPASLDCDFLASTWGSAGLADWWCQEGRPWPNKIYWTLGTGASVVRSERFNGRFDGGRGRIEDGAFSGIFL